MAAAVAPFASPIGNPAAATRKFSSMCVSQIPRSKLWNTYKAKGEKIWNDMEVALDDAGLQDRPMMNLDVFENEFEWRSHQEYANRPGYKGWVSVESYQDHDESKPESDSCQFHNLHDITSGAIECMLNRRCDWVHEILPHDDDAAKRSKVTRWTPYNWSQVAWAQWYAVCAASGTALSSLRFVIRRCISGVITEQLVDEAVLPYLGADRHYKLSVRPLTFTPQHEEFMVLLGSPNGNGTGRLCIENRNSLGGKSVKSIQIRSNGASYDMFLNLTTEPVSSKLLEW